MRELAEAAIEVAQTTVKKPEVVVARAQRERRLVRCSHTPFVGQILKRGAELASASHSRSFVASSAGFGAGSSKM